jgi:3-hydroxybutyryl-CoA dehydrogenase
MTTFRHIGIIGEGKMGTNIFHYLTGYGFQLTWICSDAADTGKLLRTFQKRIRRSLDAQLIPEDWFHCLMEKTVITTDKTSLADCDLVIEAIPENIALKRELFLELEGIVHPSCILSSNSSSILPSLLIPSGKRKDRTIVLHFFYPVSLKNIVEFVILPETPEEVISAIDGFLKQVEKKYLLLPEKGAFILNRIYLAMQNEAFHMVREGKCSFRQMDAIVKANLSPAGIFEFFDSVGNDVMLASILNYTHDDPEKENYSGLILKLKELVNEGKLGQKSGRGFFHYESPENNDPADNFEGNLLKEEIIRRLKDARQSAVATYSSLSGQSSEVLISAMNEYLGVG